MGKVIASTHRHRSLGACWWFGAVVLLAVLAAGCQQDSGRTVRVSDSPPVIPETSQPDPGATPTDSAPAPTYPHTGDNTDPGPVDSAPSPEDGAVPGPDNTVPGPGPGPGDSVLSPGDSTGGDVPPSGAGEDVPGPGSGGSPGPVGDTGGVDSGGGSGAVPGSGDLPGGLRLMAPTPPYAGLANEIFDLCDDADVYAVVFARALGPGEEMTDEERDDIAFKRQVNEVSCDEPGGRRYVYMSEVGPSGAFATPQAATEDHNDRNRYADESLIVRPPDIPLGHYGHLDWTFPLEDIDEIRVVADSVLVRDGVVRGLVRNFSKTLFGREVTVTARPTEGKEGVNNNAEPVSGRFPLTVQPGERAPFAIEGWTGSGNPADFDLEVTADLSTNVDITRSFAFATIHWVNNHAVDEEFFKDFVPDFVYQAEKHKIPDDNQLLIEHINVDLTAPTSHPSLEDQVLNQTIEDLRVYMALIGNGKIYDIVEPLLYRSRFKQLHPHDYPQVVSQPTIINGHPIYDFNVTFIPEHSWHMWVGEPGPLDHNPRTLPETPAPTPTPEQPTPAPEQPAPAPADEQQDTAPTP